MAVHLRLHAVLRRLGRRICCAAAVTPKSSGHVRTRRADAFINRSEKSADRGKQYARSHFNSKANDFEVGHGA